MFSNVLHGRDGSGHMLIDLSSEGYLATDGVVLAKALKGALNELVVDRRHPEALVVAKHIVAFAKTGERDPERLRYLAVKAVNELRRLSD